MRRAARLSFRVHWRMPSRQRASDRARAAGASIRSAASAGVRSATSQPWIGFRRDASAARRPARPHWRERRRASPRWQGFGDSSQTAGVLPETPAIPCPSSQGRAWHSSTVQPNPSVSPLEQDSLLSLPLPPLRRSARVADARRPLESVARVRPRARVSTATRPVPVRHRRPPSAQARHGAWRSVVQVRGSDCRAGQVSLRSPAHRQPCRDRSKAPRVRSTIGRRGRS
jgi:hypothetical protein